MIALPHADSPTFDTAAIRSYVELLHSRAEGVNGLFVVSVFYNDVDGGTITHHRPGDVAGMVAAISAHSETPHANVYCGLQLMRPSLGRKERGCERDIIAVLGIAADFDSDTGRTGEMPVEPSFIIQTSPGNSQPVVLFDSPVTPQMAKELASGLSAATGGDTGTKDITHVWRVPGTLNYPGETKRKRGRSPDPVPVLMLQPFQGLLHSKDTLAGVLGPHIKAAKELKPVSFSGKVDTGPLLDRLSDKARGLLTADVEKGRRSEHAASVVEQLGFEGFTLQETASLCIEHGGSWTNKYKKESTLIGDVERVWAKIVVPKRDAKAENAAAAAAMLGKAANDNQEPDSEREISIAPPKVDPFDFTESGGILGDCARWIYETSRSPVCEFSTMASIAFMGAFFGRRFVGPTGSGLNTLQVMVGPTGVGKNRPLNAPEAIAQAMGGITNSLIGPNNVTGDSAIERALRRSPTLLMPWDEFGLVLQDSTGRSATSWNVTIRRALLELYSKSEHGMSWRAKLHASSVGDKDDESIRQPTLSVLGATTPESFYAGLTASSGPLGLLNRLIVISVDKRPEKQKVQAIPILPAHTVESLIGAAAANPGNFNMRKAIPISTQPPDVYAVPYFDDEAESRFTFIEQEQERIIEQDDAMNDVFGRAAENTIRLATIRAISRDAHKPAVTVADIEWGWAIIHRSTAAVLYGVKRYMSGSAAEAFRKLMLRHIEAAGGQGVYHSTLMRRKGMSGTGREFADAIKYLTDSNQVRLIDKKYVAMDLKLAA